MSLIVCSFKFFDKCIGKTDGLFCAPLQGLVFKAQVGMVGTFGLSVFHINGREHILGYLVAALLPKYVLSG